MFGPPKLVSENWLRGQNSIERSSERENLESSCYEKTATKSAINCQSKASLQFSAIESKHNHFNFGVPQFHGTACMQSSFLCPSRQDVSQYIHSIVAYSFQHRYLFQVNIVVVRFIMNVWFNGVRFNGVRFTGYFVQNQNVSENLWLIC